MKEQIIQIPDTLEIKEIKDGKIILVEKEKKLTYNDIVEKLFPDDKILYYTGSTGYICSIKSSSTNNSCKTNATSKKQVEKLLAINMLMNVAKYLNGDWQPNWNNREEDKIYIYIDCIDENIKFGCSDVYKSLEIYFRSKKLAKQAVEILGEETIKLALCTDY